MNDWDTINDALFLAKVQTTADASERIHLPISHRKRRFPGQNPTMDPGGMKISDDGQHLSVFWHEFSAWADVEDAQGTHYGNLFFVAPINGTYWTWAIERLSRPKEAKGTYIDTDEWGEEYSDVMDIIFRGRDRPDEGALCGFWIGAWPGGTDRRSDVLPWRYRTLTEESPPPPGKSKIRAYPPGTPDVLTWPVVADVPMSARWDVVDLVISWMPGTFRKWHSVNMEVRTGVWRDVVGVVGLIYDTGEEIVCDPSDYLDRDLHDSGIRFNFQEKLRHASKDGGGPIADGEPIGIFVAGLWRHNPDPIEELRHRTAIKGFSMPGLQPVEWGEEEELPPVEPVEDDEIDRVLKVVRLELERATSKFGPMASAHEGYAVILEEMDELWEAIKSKGGTREQMQDEAVQVAAMAVRFLLDV